MHGRVFDAVAEGRGSVRGPFSIMMYSPPMCERVLNTSSFLRFQSSVKPKEGELAIIATAREKDCPFVWAAHVTLARKAGTREEAIGVVRDRKDAGGYGLVTGLLNAFEMAPAPDAEQLPV